MKDYAPENWPDSWFPAWCLDIVDFKKKLILPKPSIRLQRLEDPAPLSLKELAELRATGNTKRIYHTNLGWYGASTYGKPNEFFEYTCVLQELGSVLDAALLKYVTTAKQLEIQSKQHEQ